MNNQTDDNNNTCSDKRCLQTMMEAASALTGLGDDRIPGDTTRLQHDDDAGDDDMAKGSDLKKRYLPDHKKPDAAPTFPEKLMAMMKFSETQGDDFCVRWLEDGKSFIINDPDAFTRKVVPQYFKPTKFSSFTRKLYRWGFRQLNRGMAQDDPVIFGNDYFNRNKPELMAKMKSTTAAATRKADEEVVAHMRPTPTLAGMKRPAEVGSIELQQQILLSQLFRKNDQFENSLPFVTGPRSSLYSSGVVGSQTRPMMNGANDLSLAKMMFPGPSLPSLTFMTHSQNNSLMNQFVASGLNTLGGTNLTNSTSPSLTNNGGPFYPMSATTAEIVHAAIQALKNA